MSRGHQVSVGFITNPICVEEPCPYEILKSKLANGITFHHIGELIGGKVIGDIQLQKSYWAFDFLKRHEEDFNLVHFFDSTGYYSIKMKKMGLSFLNMKFISIQRNPSFSLTMNLQNVTSNLADFKVGIDSDLKIPNLFGDKFDDTIKVKQVLFFGNSMKHFHLFKKINYYFDGIPRSFLYFSSNWIENQKVKKMAIGMSLSIVDTPQKVFTSIQSGEHRLVVFLDNDDLPSRLLNFGIPFIIMENKHTELVYPSKLLFPNSIAKMKHKIQKIISQGFKFEKANHLMVEKKWDEFYQRVFNSFGLNYLTTPKSTLPIAFIIRVNSNFENLLNLAQSIVAQTSQNYEVALLLEINHEELFTKVRDMKNLLRQYKKILRVTFSLDPKESSFNVGAKLIPEASHYVLIDSTYSILKPEFLEIMSKVSFRENLDVLSSFYDIIPDGRKYPWPFDDEFYNRKLYIGNVLEGVIENYQTNEGVIMVKKSILEKMKFENVEGCTMWNYMIKSISLNLKVDVIPMGLIFIRNFVEPENVIKKRCSEKISTNLKEYKEIEGMIHYNIGKFYPNIDW